MIIFFNISLGFSQEREELLGKITNDSIGETFINIDGVIQPAPAPRFARTPNPKPTAPRRASMVDLEVALKPWLRPEEIEEWSKN